MNDLRGAAGAVTLASVLALGLLAATPASATKAGGPAADVISVYDFTGTCTDCDGVGKGVLTLKNVTDVSDIGAGNFVDFSYVSNLEVLDLAFVSSLAADFTNPATADVSIVASTGTPGAKGSQTWTFVSDTGKGQSWSLSPGGGGGPISQPADYGGPYSWTSASVPEPVSWALMIAGFGLAGVRLRGDRRRSARAV